MFVLYNLVRNRLTVRAKNLILESDNGAVFALMEDGLWYPLVNEAVIGLL